MRRITMRDISKLFSSSAVLRKSQPILIKLQVASCTCTHRSNCQENLLGTGGSVLLHPSPPGWSPAEGVMMIWRKELSRTDRNGDVEVWGVVGPAHYSIRNKTSRLGRASQNGSQVGFIAKSRLPLNKTGIPEEEISHLGLLHSLGSLRNAAIGQRGAAVDVSIPGQKTRWTKYFSFVQAV